MDASYTMQSFNTHKITSVFKRNKNGYEAGIGGFYTYSDNDYDFITPKQYGALDVKRDHDQFRKFVLGGGIKTDRWWFDEFEIEPAMVLSSKQIQGIEFNIQEAKSRSNAFLVAQMADKKDFLVEGLNLDFDNTYAYTQYWFNDESKYKYSWDGGRQLHIHESGIGLGEIGILPNDVYNQKHTIYQKTNLNYVIDRNNAINFNSHLRHSMGLPSDTLKDAVLGYKTSFNSTLTSWTAGFTYEFNSVNKKFTNAASVKYYYYSMQTKLIEFIDFNRIPEDIDNRKNDYGISNAMRYRFTPEFLIKASCAYDVRLPDDNELLGDGFIVTPAGNLGPERNTSVNIGVMYNKINIRNNRLQIEVNAFYQYLENMIRFTGGPLQNKYQNFGKMRSLGAEAEVKWDATSWLYLWGNATYQDLRDVRKYEPGSQDKNTTYMDRMPNIPYLLANGGVEFHEENLFGGKGQNTRLFGDCSFIEEYFFDFEQSIFQQNRIPRSITFNAGLEHSFKNQSIFLSLQANNISDAKVMSQFNRPLPGRNFGLKSGMYGNERDYQVEGLKACIIANIPEDKDWTIKALK